MRIKLNANSDCGFVLRGKKCHFIVLLTCILKLIIAFKILMRKLKGILQDFYSIYGVHNGNIECCDFSEY